MTITKGNLTLKLPNFNYTRAEEILDEIHLIDDYKVVIVGSAGSYEYLIVKANEVLDFSDVGYGRLSLAIKDAMVFYFNKYEAIS